MTSVFGADGKNIPCTVIEAGPCVVTQLKTVEKDGYKAAQVGFMHKSEKHTNKAEAGHFKAAGVEPMRHLAEFEFDGELALGQTITAADLFEEGMYVDVIGTSKGHGYTGPIQRWNQHTGPMAHGSKYHRGVGSMSANSDPSRVFKNKHMAGHYGVDRVTVQNLEVVQVDAERNLLLVKGAVPGPNEGLLIIRDTCKA